MLLNTKPRSIDFVFCSTCSIHMRSHASNTKSTITFYSQSEATTLLNTKPRSIDFVFCSSIRFFLSLLILLSEKSTPNSFRIFCRSVGEVSSSFLSISVSMKFMISGVTVSLGRPGGGTLANDCLSWNRIKNSLTLRRLLLFEARRHAVKFQRALSIVLPARAESKLFPVKN